MSLRLVVIRLVSFELRLVSCNCGIKPDLTRSTTLTMTNSTKHQQFSSRLLTFTLLPVFYSSSILSWEFCFVYRVTLDKQLCPGLFRPKDSTINQVVFQGDKCHQCFVLQFHFVGVFFSCLFNGFSHPRQMEIGVPRKTSTESINCWCKLVYGRWHASCVIGSELIT